MTCFAFFHVITELEHLEKGKKVEKKITHSSPVPQNNPC